VALVPADYRLRRNLALVLSQRGRAADLAEAIAHNRKAVQLTPDDAVDLNDLAWLLANSPDPRLRDPVAAVAAATRAVKLAPKDGNGWNTLGVAYYRKRDWNAAVAALEKSMAVRKGGDAFDWFFLAMAHWQLGEKDQARTWYDNAVPWSEKNQPHNEELLRFRAEAEALMGIRRPVEARRPLAVRKQQQQPVPALKP
jgi:tetratricopeptide (TPR) repeat protein